MANEEEAHCVKRESLFLLPVSLITRRVRKTERNPKQANYIVRLDRLFSLLGTIFHRQRKLISEENVVVYAYYLCPRMWK